VGVFIAVVVVAGAAYSFRLGDSLRYDDERDYLALIANMSSHGMFATTTGQPTASRAPGYPAFLFALQQVFGPDVTWLRFGSFILFGFNLSLLYGILRRTHSARAGLLAVIAAALYPVNFYTAGTLFPQTLAACLLLLAIALGLGMNEGKPLVASLFGLTVGALILTVPSFTPVAVVLAAIAVSRAPRRRPWLAAAVALSVLVVLMPWQARNVRTFSGWFFVSSNAGVNLILGNSENTRPIAGSNVDISRYEDAVRGWGEVAKDRYWTRAALQYMRGHPGRTAQLYVLKFLNYFNFRNELATSRQMSRRKDIVMLLTYGPLLLVCLARLALARRQPLSGFEKTAVLLYVLNGLVAAVFFTRIRFRVPFDYLLVAFAAQSVARWLPASATDGRGVPSEPG